jgi:DNA-binding transcriptional regulator YiaG
MPTPKQIRATRTRLGMTQRQLAKALGLKGDNCWRTVQDWELGISAAPEYLSLALKQLRKQS